MSEIYQKNTKVEHQTKEKMIVSEQMIAWQIYEQRKWTTYIWEAVSHTSIRIQCLQNRAYD